MELDELKDQCTAMNSEIEPPVQNWHSELRVGFVDIMPISVGVLAYGLVFGLLCAQAGMDGLQTGVMGATAFAGASQIVLIERVVAGAGAAAALLAGLALNLRIFLITASLQQDLAGRPWWQLLLGIHLAADENWALMHAKRNSGAVVGYWYFVGGGICLMAAWLISTVFGVTVAYSVPEPRSFGLDFAFSSAYIAILRGLWQDRSDFLPWCVSISLSFIIVMSTPLDTSWAIIIGGGLGATVAGTIKKV